MSSKASFEITPPPIPAKNIKEAITSTLGATIFAREHSEKSQA